MSYRFFTIDSNNFQRQCFPFEGNKLEIERKRDLKAGQIFYRDRLSGDLVFINDKTKGIFDFDYFLSFEKGGKNCDKFQFIIEVLCDDGYQELWRGEFTTGMGEFDLDRCVFKVQPEPLDRYTCILSELERKINILDVEDVVETQSFVIADYEFLICRSATQNQFELNSCYANRPAPPETWRIFQRSSTLPELSNATLEWVVIYFRQRAVTSCVAGQPVPPASGSDWKLLIDDCANSQTAVWVRYPDLPVGFSQYQNRAVQPGACTGTFGTIEETPPPELRLDVKIQNKTQYTPKIFGWTYGLPGIFKFKLIGFPAYNSVQWSIPITGASILSGQGTDEITVQFTGSYAGYVRAHIVFTDLTISQYAFFYIGQTQQQTASKFIELIGPKYLCVGQKNCRYEAPELPSLSAFGSTVTAFWIVPTGGTITSGGGANDNFVEFDLPLNFEGTATVQCNLTMTQPGLSRQAFATLEIDVSKYPYTGNEATPLFPYRGIIGADGAEGNTQCIYKVHQRPNSTYYWRVIGGDIISGQGTNEVVIEWGNGTDGIVFVKETMQNNCCQWVQITPCGANGEPPYFWCGAAQIITYSRNRWLLGVIEYMYQNIECDIDKDVVSDFFEWNPPGDTPGYAPGINYFTGQVNQVNFLTIAAKSDIILPTASNPATKALWTLKEAFSVLREMFQCYWFIDDDGNLRIEHISYFIYPVNTDLTVYSKYVQGLNSYKYLRSEIPKYERFRFMEALNTDFIGTEIWYDSLCANNKDGENVLEHNAQRITTDIDYIFTNPNDISKDGFVILANYFTGAGYEVIFGLGELTGAAFPNVPLAWANLHKAFHRFWRFLPQGYMNNQLTSFPQPQPMLRGKEFEVPMCCDFITLDAKFRVRTVLGDRLGNAGFMESAKYNLIKKTVTFVIQYQK